MSVEDKKREIILTKEEIQIKVEEMGKILTKDYADKKLLVVSLLKGSFIFTADLVRAIDLPVRIEFMTTSSYGHSTSSTGKLNVVQDIDAELEEYDVLIVDDITDTAITMDEVVKLLSKRNSKSIKSCVFLDKPSRKEADYVADYICVEVEDKFIVGYGLNYGDYYRNVDHIFAFVD